MSTEAPFRIDHVLKLHRFDLSRDGVELAHVEYVPRDGVWVITHSWTEPAARGQGLAAKVVAATLEGARAAGVKVRPVCPYVVDFLGEHPEFHDVVQGQQ
ncbi:N-acetyltransferase [Nakamurella antarctica]|uniref:N-acetyltransferase n=1 Tax=Nakamurella antarctica TaxID=1902245 RepID=A0A3G8ZI06_9ACTN|nr:GNAT family N-acetyltransferase [Nakamurella antarctica]AZI57022.1 N-acetyltransferase [Nakamurella antarctica]